MSRRRASLRRNEEHCSRAVAQGDRLALEEAPSSEGSGMSLFWDLYQDRRISEAEADASRAKFTAKQTQLDVGALRRRAETALLACEAMWTLLRDKLGVSEDELLERVKELDMTDGKLDGRVRKPPVECPACHRTTPQRLAHCMYCGEAIQRDPFAT